MIGKTLTWSINGHRMSGTVLSFDTDSIYVQVGTDEDNEPLVFCVSTSADFSY